MVKELKEKQDLLIIKEELRLGDLFLSSSTATIHELASLSIALLENKLVSEYLEIRKQSSVKLGRSSYG